MQRLDSNVEEQMIGNAIEEEASWENLPKRLKLYLHSNDEWNKKIKEYCIKKRFKWIECLAKNTCKENDYYDELMRYLRRNSALFPYHLSDYVCRVLRVSPFRHYCDVLYEALRDERPYDSIPNFSAADALRVTGIGRNEYIGILNKCRSKKIMWKINKSIARDMLPSEPADICIEAWWIINVVNLSQDEQRKLSDEESMVIDKICKDDIIRFGEHDPDVIRGLYRRGLVYFDVPVFSEDHFQVSTLEGFVSNKDQSHEDPIEELLYAVFITSSEHATVAELAATLQADLSKLEATVSLAARLGWAKKIVDPEALLYEPNAASPKSDGGIDDASGSMSPLQGLGDIHGETSSADLLTVYPGLVRLAFLVDANLTSYIMMGSLSPGLKGHAVTLYEAGKLGDSNVLEMCEDLRKVEGTELEGELQHFADHAFSLRHALECLRSAGTGILDDISPDDDDIDEAKSPRRKKVRVDVVRCESLAGLTPATIQRVFRRDYDVIVSMVPLPSLPAVISPDENGPVHFGPPYRAAITPWMKLLLYSVAEAGPVSVALIRGQRLRILPASLSGCFKALVWTWDGSGVGGAGGKFEGTLVEGGVLLHVVNSLLKHSAVLVQPYPKECFQNDEKEQLVMEDIALPLCTSNITESYAGTLSRAAEELHLNTMGYIRLVRFCRTPEHVLEWVPQSVEFGVPLFSTALCKLVCEGVVKCGLFEAGNLMKHRQAMASFRTKLQDFISDYQANGPISRLAYSVVQTTNVSIWDGSVPSTSSTNGQQLRRLQSERGSVEGDAIRTYTLSVGEDQLSPSPKGAVNMFLDAEDDEVPLPGVNLIFNGSWLAALDISACLQGKPHVRIDCAFHEQHNLLEGRKEATALSFTSSNALNQDEPSCYMDL